MNLFEQYDEGFRCQGCGKRVVPPARRCDYCWRRYGRYFKGEITDLDEFQANVAGLTALQLMYVWWDPKRQLREGISLHHGIDALERACFKLDPASAERLELLAIVSHCREDHALDPEGSDFSIEIAKHFGAYIDLLAERRAVFLVARAREIGAPPQDAIRASVERLRQAIDVDESKPPPHSGLARTSAQSVPSTDRLRDAEAFLRRILISNRQSKDVMALGRVEGFGEKVIRKAAHRLGVRTSRLGFGKDGITLWMLPK